MSDVFISYSRVDTEFVRQLFDALRKRNHDAWVDWQGINYSTHWWEEICAGIEGADNFVLILSPDSLASEYCHRELEHARLHKKRIVTLVYRDYDQTLFIASWYDKQFEATARSNWEYLKSLQYISLSELENDFERVLEALIDTVESNPEHVKMHTTLLLASRAWESKGRNPGYLLRGERLSEAEKWMENADQESDRQPQPTEEQRTYIEESRRAEDEFADQIAQRERSVRRFRRTILFLAITALVVLIVAVAAGATTVQAINVAETAAAEARKQYHLVLTSQIDLANANATVAPIQQTLTQADTRLAQATGTLGYVQAQGTEIAVQATSLAAKAARFATLAAGSVVSPSITLTPGPLLPPLADEG